MLWQEKRLLMYKSLRSFVLCSVISRLQKLGLATAVQTEIEVETGQSCTSSSSFQTCQRNAVATSSWKLKWSNKWKGGNASSELPGWRRPTTRVWRYGTQGCGDYSSAGLTAGLDNLTGLFQPERFYDSTTEGEASSARLWRKGGEEDPSQQTFPREQHIFWF